MSVRIVRNAVVTLLGTPDRNDGSLNSPIELEVHGKIYNEKWIYVHLVDDPAGVPTREIYWHRYDFVDTQVRGGPDEEWRPDTKLADALSAVPERLPPIVDEHSPVTPTGLYHPASEVQGPDDLGGYIMGQKKD